jgi:hypothetical protein
VNIPTQAKTGLEWATRQLVISAVILSEGTASRSEAVPKSKDPCTAGASVLPQGILPRVVGIVRMMGHVSGATPARTAAPVLRNGKTMLGWGPPLGWSGWNHGVSKKMPVKSRGERAYRAKSRE